LKEWPKERLIENKMVEAAERTRAEEAKSCEGGDETNQL
jgi:hypothetical protein